MVPQFITHTHTHTNRRVYYVLLLECRRLDTLISINWMVNINLRFLTLSHNKNANHPHFLCRFQDVLFSIYEM